MLSQKTRGCGQAAWQVFVDPAIYPTALLFGFKKLKAQYPGKLGWQKHFSLKSMYKSTWSPVNLCYQRINLFPLGNVMQCLQSYLSGISQKMKQTIEWSGLERTSKTIQLLTILHIWYCWQRQLHFFCFSRHCIFKVFKKAHICLVYFTRSPSNSSSSLGL